MSPIELQFYWLAVASDAMGCFWGHMMEAAEFIGEPPTVDLSNVIPIRKGE